MKQIWPNYSYSPTTNVLTLTGLNIDRDQLLLVSAPERGRIMYNFADSTVTASAFTAGANTGLTLVASTAGLTTTAALVIYYDDQLASTTVTVSSLPAISGTVTANILSLPDNATGFFGDGHNNLHSLFESGALVITPISGTVTVGNSVTIAGTVTIGAGTAEIGTVKPAKNQSGNAQFLSVDDGSGKLFTSTLLTAGTAQIGSVTASISNSVTIASLPAISGTVTANTFAVQGTAVTTSNFTSTTASTVLANYNATRQVLTIFSEGPGTLFVAPGATCTTIAYQVRLSSGDYYEVPNHQTTITHSAVFATAGTARICQVS